MGSTNADIPSSGQWTDVDMITPELILNMFLTVQKRVLHFNYARPCLSIHRSKVVFVWDINPNRLYAPGCIGIPSCNNPVRSRRSTRKRLLVQKHHPHLEVVSYFICLLDRPPPLPNPPLHSKPYKRCPRNLVFPYLTHDPLIISEN